MTESASNKFSREIIIASFLLLLGAIMFSTKGIIAKLIYRHEISVLTVLSLRMLFAIPMYLIVYFFRRKGNSSEIPLSKSDWISVLGVGILGYYLASWFDFIALQHISAGMERLIFFSFPTLVVIISYFFFKEKITPQIVVALLLTYVGIAIAFMDKIGMSAHSNFKLGMLFTLLTALTYSIYVVISGQIVSRIGVLRYTCIGMMGAAIAVLLHYSIAEGFALLHFDSKIYFLAFLMALISTVLPSFMILEGIRLIGASHSSILLSIGPIATLIMAKYFLGEAFGYLQLGGTILVIIGIIYLSFERNRNSLS